MYQASRGRAAPPARRTYAAHKGMRYNCICPLYAPICKDPKPTRICPQYISANVTRIMFSSKAWCGRLRQTQRFLTIDRIIDARAFFVALPASVGDRNVQPRATRRPYGQHGRLVVLIVLALSLLQRPSHVPCKQGQDQSGRNEKVRCP